MCPGSPALAIFDDSDIFRQSFESCPSSGLISYTSRWIVFLMHCNAIFKGAQILVFFSQNIVKQEDD